MQKPNYQNASIVNLMSSVFQACGAPPPEYNNAADLPASELVGGERRIRNIILLVIDGLGLRYLQKHGQNSVLSEHLRSTLTSVFPSTTASAVTTFATGTAPLQHGITGWFMQLKELGCVTAVLPFVPRARGAFSFERFPVMREIFPLQPLIAQLNRKAYVINRDDLIESPFSRLTTPNTQRLGYSGLEEMFRNISDIVRSDSAEKYVYAYWPQFDALCHEFGVAHEETHKHFRQIDEAFAAFLDTIKNSNSAVIVTADHGLINTSEENTVYANDHVPFADALSLPLCGEPRTAYCYVHAAKSQRFETYVSNHMQRYCEMFSSRQLIAQDLFGLGTPNPKFLDRVGHYVLVMKENFTLRDRLPGENPPQQIGVHGGWSDEEMLVPLIVHYC
jgi:hypothetical protein